MYFDGDTTNTVVVVLRVRPTVCHVIAVTTAHIPPSGLAMGLLGLPLKSREGLNMEAKLITLSIATNPPVVFASDLPLQIPEESGASQ